MRDELLAYLLGDASPEERAQIEQRIEQDPAWKRELERLQECLESNNPSTSDNEDRCPPTDLVSRTCTFVKRAAADSSTECCGTVVPGSLSESRDPSSGVSRWSWSDLTVGSGILLALTVLALPALQNSREAARRLTCQNKLKTMGTALEEYATLMDGRLPEVNPGENAGIIVVRLADRGVLTREQLAELIVCPSTDLAEKVFAGRIILRIPTHQELKASPAEVLAQLREYMSGSFASRIGYLTADGKYRQVKFVGCSKAPLMADTPSFKVAGFQSGNHGGCGQNVLYQGGNVKYTRQCIGEECKDHLFLNTEDEHAVGLHKHDVVLMRSEGVPVTQSLVGSGR